jgi:alkylation response protein AidB-like acyl-CoA dehydrogenase
MISKMLTVTRIYNASTAVGIMRRVVALSRDYASRRVIGKSKLS